jgi:hypothetical protein
MAERRKNPARRKSEPPAGLVRSYHVVPTGRRFEVERDGMFSGAFAYDVHTAIGIATIEANRDVHNGLVASVCVEESDGTCRHVWP